MLRRPAVRMQCVESGVGVKGCVEQGGQKGMLVGAASNTPEETPQLSMHTRKGRLQHGVVRYAHHHWLVGLIWLLEPCIPVTIFAINRHLIYIPTFCTNAVPRKEAFM